MLLFLIGIELLTQKILSSTKIQGIFLGSTSLKVSHYADDLTFFISSPDSFTPIRKIIEEISHYSGLKINQSKTTIFLIPLNYYQPIVLLFHKEKSLHLLKYSELISHFKTKTYPKTGMNSFVSFLILLFLPLILKTHSFPKLLPSINISSPKYYSYQELFYPPLNNSNS